MVAIALSARMCFFAMEPVCIRSFERQFCTTDSPDTRIVSGSGASTMARAF